MPIDSSNTMLAFYGYNRYANTAEKEFKTFSDIFLKSYRIAKNLDLLKPVDYFKEVCVQPKWIFT